MRVVLGMLISVMIFLPSGNKFNKNVGKIPSREPYEIVDTLKLTAGFGALVLNSHFTGQKHNVKPTSKNNIYPFVTQILSDTSGTVYYYAVYISDNLDSIIVKSSDATDVSTLRVRALMK